MTDYLSCRSIALSPKKSFPITKYFAKLSLKSPSTNSFSRNLLEKEKVEIMTVTFTVCDLYPRIKMFFYHTLKSMI